MWDPKVMNLAFCSLSLAKSGYVTCSGLNTANNIVGKKMFGLSKILDMSDIFQDSVID